MKEYYTYQIAATGNETQKEIDEIAERGWVLVCSYARGKWLIFEREKKTCPACGK